VIVTAMFFLNFKKTLRFFLLVFEDFERFGRV